MRPAWVWKPVPLVALPKLESCLHPSAGHDQSSKQGLGQRGSECRPLSNEPESDGSSVVGRMSLTESLPFVDHPRVLLLSFPRSPPPSFLRDVGCASQRCPSSCSWGYRPGWTRTIALPPGAGRGPGHRLCMGRLSTHTGAVGPRRKQRPTLGRGATRRPNLE